MKIEVGSTYFAVGEEEEKIKFHIIAEYKTKQGATYYIGAQQEGSKLAARFDTLLWFNEAGVSDRYHDASDERWEYEAGYKLGAKSRGKAPTMCSDDWLYR